MTSSIDPNGPHRPESHGEPLSEPAPVSGLETRLEHWCEEHRAAFTQRNGKGGKSWWSHKAPNGSWCRE